MRLDLLHNGRLVYQQCSRLSPSQYVPRPTRYSRLSEQRPSSPKSREIDTSTSGLTQRTSSASQRGKRGPPVKNSIKANTCNSIKRKREDGAEEDLPDGGGRGSGYPSDPRTQAYLRENIDPIFGYKGIVRFSWATVKVLLEKQALECKW